MIATLKFKLSYNYSNQLSTLSTNSFPRKVSTETKCDLKYEISKKKYDRFSDTIAFRTSNSPLQVLANKSPRSRDNEHEERTSEVAFRLRLTNNKQRSLERPLNGPQRRGLFAFESHLYKSH